MKPKKIIHHQTPWVVYGLLMVFCIPLIAASLLYYFRDSVMFTQTCAGHLYTPPIEAYTLGLEQNTQHKNKWQILYLTSNACGAECEQRYHTLQSLHIALGKEQSRVVLHSLMLPSSPVHNFEPGSLLIIDPHGWLLMEYSINIPPKAILTDLKRLLRLSHVG